MPQFVAETIYVLALQGFLARPGHAALPGELVKVAPDVANRAIAAGQARLPTAEDLRAADAPAPPIDPKTPGAVQTRDPVAVNRDPPIRKKRRL